MYDTVCVYIHDFQTNGPDASIEPPSDNLDSVVCLQYM